MAVTFTGAGVTNNAIGGTSIAATTTTAFAVGDYFVALISYDNSGGGGADPITGQMSAAPATGAVGTIASSQTGLNDPGTASSGLAARCAAWPVTTAIPSGTSVTLSWSGGTSGAKAAVFMKVSSAGTTGYRTNSGAVGTNGVAVTTVALTTPSITSGEGVLCWAGHENGAAITGDADTTNGTWSAVYGTFNGTGLTGMAAYFQSKVVTATATQAFNPTGTSSDWIVGCLIFTETVTATSLAGVRIYQDDAHFNTATPAAAQNTDISIVVSDPDTRYLYRVLVQNVTASPVSSTVPVANGLTMQRRINGGAWASMTGTEGVRVGPSTFWTAGDSITTARLTGGTGTFGTGRATQGAVSNNLWGDIPASGYSEYIWAINTQQSLLVVGDVWEFRLVHDVTAQRALIYPLSPLKFTIIAAPNPAITQAAYQWFAEGTETGATTLAAQDTAVTGDITNGDATGTLRIRLQSTTAVAVPATDDFQLQYQKNGGTWTNVSAVTTNVSTYDSPNLTNGGATTNRLTGGTGSFVAGKVSEDSLMDDLGWAGNNYTELVYALKVKAADVAATDTLTFRVLRNSAITTMTYSVTPTINIIKSPVGVLVQTDGRDTLAAGIGFAAASPDTGERFIESIVARTTEGDAPRYLESFVAPTFTATPNLTDGRDTIVAVATFGPTAAVALTDGRDTLTAVPAFGPTASVAVTDGRDTLTAVPAFVSTASVVITDGQDTLTAVSAFVSTATITFTDGRDTLTAVPTFGPTAAAALTDGRDTVTATATFGPTATLALADGPDTWAAIEDAAPPVHTATLLLTDGVDTIVTVASADVAAPSECVLAAIDGVDTILAAGTTTAPTFVATLPITDGLDTIAAAATATPPTHTATLSITDGRDTVVSVGSTVAPTYTSTATATDGVDTIIALVSAGAVGAAVLAVADGIDTIVATGATVAPTYTATTALTDGPDTLTATVTATAPTHTATLLITDGRDTLVAAVNTVAPTFTATLSFTDGLDTLVAAVSTTAPTHTATVVRTDGVDTIVTTVSALPPPNPSTLALTDGADTLVALVSAGAVGAAVMGVADLPDTIVSAATATPPTHTATVALTDGRDIIVPTPSTAPPTITATSSVSDGLDTLVAAVNTVAPIQTTGLSAADGQDTLTAAVTFVPVPNPSTLALTDGRDTIVAAVSHAAPGNSTAGLTGTDQPDTIVAVGNTTAPTFTSTFSRTDGVDTLLAAGVFTAAPMNYGAAAVSHIWIPGAQGKRVPKAAVVVFFTFDPGATGLTGIVGFFEGQWNGVFFDVMQYGDKAVIDWLMVPS